MTCDEIIGRKRPQRFLKWLALQLVDHLPPRTSVMITNSSFYGDPNMKAPMIQINSPVEKNG